MNIIKSKELCDRCVYGDENTCSKYDDVTNDAICVKCPNKGPLGCNCFNVQKNTPCPYFQEKE